MSSLRAFLPSLMFSFVLAGCNPPPTANSRSGDPAEASSSRAEMPRETQLESSSELSHTEPQLKGENLQRESLKEQCIEPGVTETLAFYTIDHYDEARDPAKDLVETLVRAQAEDKCVLLQVGGEWCGWCKLMSKFIESNTAVRERMDERFLLMKVTWMPDQKNEPLSRLSNLLVLPGRSRAAKVVALRG